MIKHFYIYNECYKAISSNVRYLPVGTSVEETTTVVVAPGNQRLLCTTDEDSIATESKSEDDSLRWSLQKIPLSGFEYTHVIACKCPAGDANCTTPDAWPYETSRQFPTE